jgi:hypothetical protein
MPYSSVMISRIPSYSNDLEHSRPITSSMRRAYLFTLRAARVPLIDAWQLIPTSANRLRPRRSASFIASGLAA